jgi:ubiquinone/menaquinone biosynthesis C-methylase UbiE
MNKLINITTGIRSRLIIEAYQNWVNKHDRVLDVGCGDGILSEILQKSLDIKLTGCDIENYFKTKIPFRIVKEESVLPFPKNSFDIVMFNDSLHHINMINQKKLLQEALRIANKILIFEDEPNWVETIVDWGINKFHNKNMPVTLSFRKPTQWIELFKDLDVKYKYKKVRKPFGYPLTHEAFYLYKTK